jgi:peptide/nickel transport system substrate-binding protein
VGDSHRHPARGRKGQHRWLRFAAAGACVALIAAACGGGGGGGGDSSSGGGGDGGAGASDEFSGPQDEGKPQRGGKVVYGLEAETGGGWCLPTAQLAAGGIQVATSVYDTLVAPAVTDDGGVEYVPFLAESVEPNDDYTQWTITVRDGITFHDGTPLNAEAVKLNLDAFRGQVPGVAGPLFPIVFSPITSVDVVDDRTVNVNMSIPWVAFDATLWGTGRIGISAPAQFANPDDCETNLIGTGPFRIFNCENVDCGWVINDRFTAEANPDYWREDADGEKLPYLDEIEYRPVPQVAQRVNGLSGGELQAMHTSDGATIADLRVDADAGQINLLESDFAAEVGYSMLQVEDPPFNNKNARKALQYGLDADELIELTQGGVTPRAVQPFSPDNLAYLDPGDVGWPKRDLDRAKEYLDAYFEETGETELTFTILTTNDPVNLRLAQLVQDQLGQIGPVNATIDQVDQTEIINTALGGEFGLNLWRNHPGGDPDTQRIWWYSKTPTGAANFVNFGRINDPEIDRLFDEARSEPDPEARKELYQQVSKVFAEEAYNLWAWYTVWAFATADNVHGLYPPPLPDGQEAALIASVEPIVGLWIEQ